jgi:hypothetical protein
MASLERVIEMTRSSEDPWWLIGSAAMALHGVRQLQVADIDLLMSRNDARRLLREQRQPNTPDGGTEHFRSDVFGRLRGGPLSIDVMGGFHVRQVAAWREVVPTTRVAVRIPSGLVFVPAVSDLLDITRHMGREKDRDRAEMLEKLL